MLDWIVKFISSVVASELFGLVIFLIVIGMVGLCYIGIEKVFKFFVVSLSDWQEDVIYTVAGLLALALLFSGVYVYTHYIE